MSGGAGASAAQIYHQRKFLSYELRREKFMKKLLTIILTITVLVLAAVFNWHGEAVEAKTGGESCPAAINNEIVFTRNRDIYVMNPDGTGLIQLTVGAEAFGPDVSTDGRKIVYTSARNYAPGDPGNDIFVMNADGSGEVQLTSQTGRNLSPSFSPDGSKIVFTSTRPVNGGGGTFPKVFVMNADGTNVVHVPIAFGDNSTPSQTSFSRDGTKILLSDGNQAGDIYIMNTDGSNFVNLTEGSPAHENKPRFNPDGTKIVFNCSSEICVMNADGTGRVQYDLDEFDAPGGAFSPDGTKIVYSSYRGNFENPINYELFMINSDGTGTVQQLTDHESVNDGDPVMGWSLDSDNDCVVDSSDNCPLDPNSDQGDNEADGEGDVCDADDDNDGIDDKFDNCPLAVNSYRVAFSNGLYIYTMNENGSGRTQLTFGPTTYREIEPEFNRAGTRIVFQSNRTNNRNEIYSMNPDGTGITQLTNIAGGNQQPSYSPDGSKIVFSSRRTRPGSSNDLYVMNADGSNQVGLGILGTFITESPSFNQDGTRIVYSAGRLTGPTSSTQDIYAINPDGTNDVRLTTAAGVDNQPAFSPDGSKIAFVSFRGGDPDGEIYVMNADGTNQTRLTDDTREDRNPTFTPDGTKITFNDRVDSQLSRVNVDGTGLVRLTNSFAYLYPSYTTQPDADGDGTGDVCDSDFSVNTPTGTNVAVQAPNGSVSFSNVSQSGTTSFTPITPNQNDVPTGYTLCPNCPAYEITTTANYTPPIEVCLGVPASVSPSLFLQMRLLHGENGMLVDRTTNRVTDGNGQRFVCGEVNSLSPFVLASSAVPTAAQVLVSGRISTKNGAGISNVRVSLTSSDGETRTTLSNSFGFYHFAEVPAGETYTVSVASKRFSFNQQTVVISVFEEIANLDFIGAEQ